MRARTLVLVASLAALALAPGTGASAKPDPERVMVRGLEFDLLLSKQKLVPGRAIIQFVNAGEDPHDLRIQRVGQAEEFGFPEIAPGEFESLDTRPAAEVDLRPVVLSPRPPRARDGSGVADEEAPALSAG